MLAFARGILRLKARELVLRLAGLIAKLLDGDVSERPKVQLSKSCVGESPPWVQIPPSPRCDVSRHSGHPNPRMGSFLGTLRSGVFHFCPVSARGFASGN